jgi:DNA topoisomerase VI subunit B
MIKERMKITLPPKVKNYIQAYMEKHHLRYTGDAISRICKEHEEAQKGEKDSLEKVVEAVSQNIEALLKRERLHMREELYSLEKNIQRSTLNSIKTVEDYGIRQRGELFASFLEEYKK